jgi:hypothetical protein
MAFGCVETLVQGHILSTTGDAQRLAMEQEYNEKEFLLIARPKLNWAIIDNF